MHRFSQTMIFILAMALVFFLPHAGSAQVHAARAARGGGHASMSGNRTHAPHTGFKGGMKGYYNRSARPDFGGKSYGGYSGWKGDYRSHQPGGFQGMPYDHGKRFINPPNKGFGEFNGDFNRKGYDRFENPDFNRHFSGQPFDRGQPFDQGKHFKRRVDRSYTYFSEFPLRRPRGTYGPDSEFPLRRSGRQFDHKFDGKFDHKFDGKFDGKFDRNFDRKFDNFDRKFDRKFDNFDRKFDRKFDGRHFSDFPKNRFDHPYGYYGDFPSHRYDRSYQYHRRPQQQYDIFSVPFRPGERYPQ